MEKVSQTNLEQFYRKEFRKGKADALSQIEEIRSGEGKKSNTIFLSHSHKDKTIVDKISLLFSSLDSNLYVDWLDKTLPEQTNRETASAIQSKIRDTKHFLFLATYHALRSKWCNWELGIADSMLSERKLAILPIESRGGNWAGNEYLNLYPEMKIDGENLDNLTIEKIFIQQLDGKKIPLKDWLK